MYECVIFVRIKLFTQIKKNKLKKGITLTKQTIKLKFRELLQYQIMENALLQMCGFAFDYQITSKYVHV